MPEVNFKIAPLLEVYSRNNWKFLSEEVDREAKILKYGQLGFFICTVGFMLASGFIVIWFDLGESSFAFMSCLWLGYYYFRNVRWILLTFSLKISKFLFLDIATDGNREKVLKDIIDTWERELRGVYFENFSCQAFKTMERNLLDVLSNTKATPLEMILRARAEIDNCLVLIGRNSV